MAVYCIGLFSGCPNVLNFVCAIQTRPQRLPSDAIADEPSIKEALVKYSKVSEVRLTCF